MKYGAVPQDLGPIAIDLREVMCYLYLPVFMADKPRADGQTLMLPPNVECLRPLINKATAHVARNGWLYIYTYLSARKGWATPDNPLNRPGWHCDGFGTDDMNYVWWKGPGTRFAYGDFRTISDDHKISLDQFAVEIDDSLQHGAGRITIDEHRPEGHIYRIDPFVVHATPLIITPCWRQYVKISFSNEKYNLENNSHNYLFDYRWPLHSREAIRNDPHRAQADSAGP